MEEKSALEELQYIRKVIEETKKALIFNGLDYIIWGSVIAAALICTYISAIYEIYKYFNPFWIWTILVPVGWIFSFVYGRRKRNKQPIAYAGKLLNALWAASGIAMMIIGFVGPFTRAYNPLFISPIISIILGIAYFVTGTIVEAKWIKNLSFGWWIGAIFMLSYHNIITLLVMALMMICFQTLPGIIMYIKYKNLTK